MTQESTKLRSWQDMYQEGTILTSFSRSCKTGQVANSMLRSSITSEALLELFISDGHLADQATKVSFHASYSEEREVLRWDDISTCKLNLNAAVNSINPNKCQNQEKKRKENKPWSQNTERKMQDMRTLGVAFCREIIISSLLLHNLHSNVRVWQT